MGIASHVFEWTLEGKRINIPLDQVSFSQIDSIYAFYNTATLQVLDQNAFMKESSLLTRGRVMTLSFGAPADSMVNRCDYVIVDVRIDFNMGAKGPVTLDLYNAAFIRQTLECKAHRGNISDIVNAIMSVSKYGLRDRLDITDVTTPIDTIWYQPYLTDAKFIETILVPNAYAADAEVTPYYAYFTSDGKFHFRNLASLKREMKKDGKTIKFLTSSSNQSVGVQAMTASKEVLENTEYTLEHFRLNKIKKESSSLIETFPLLRRQSRVVCFHDTASLKTTASFGKNVEASLSLMDTSKTARVRPIQFCDDAALTSWSLQYKTENTQTEDDINRAQLLQDMRFQFFQEHYSIQAKYNPQFHAGDVLVLSFEVPELANNVSKTLSDMYIVESAEHIWRSGDGASSITKLVVGRPAITAFSLKQAKDIADNGKFYTGKYTHESIYNEYFKKDNKYGNA